MLMKGADLQQRQASRARDERTVATGRNAMSQTQAGIQGFRWNLWWHLLDCKLCRSIAFPVFVSILAIESIILIPSSLNFCKNELRRLEEKAVATVNAALMIDGQLRPEQLPAQFSGLLRDTQILGLTVLRRNGSILARAGDADFNGFNIETVLRDPHQVARRRILNLSAEQFRDRDLPDCVGRMKTRRPR